MYIYIHIYICIYLLIHSSQNKFFNDWITFSFTGKLSTANWEKGNHKKRKTMALSNVDKFK